VKPECNNGTKTQTLIKSKPQESDARKRMRCTKNQTEKQMEEAATASTLDNIKTIVERKRKEIFQLTSKKEAENALNFIRGFNKISQGEYGDCNCDNSSSLRHLTEPALKKKCIEKNTFIKILNIIDEAKELSSAAWTNQTEKTCFCKRVCVEEMLCEKVEE